MVMQQTKVYTLSTNFLCLYIKRSTKKMGHFQPHLSKRSSDLNQKCTLFQMPFSGIVYHFLLHSVVCFVPSVLKTPIELVTFRTKWIIPCDRECKTLPKTYVNSCVRFSMRLLVPTRRFAKWQLISQTINIWLKGNLKDLISWISNQW